MAFLPRLSFILLMRTRLVLFWLALALAIGIAGCEAAPTKKAFDLSYKHLPEHPLFALSVADACIVVLDADARQVVGTIKSPQFNASTDIELNARHELVATIDADADHDYREILFLDPAKGEERARVTVAWAPVRLGISAADALLVGHTLEKSSNGHFDLSLLDGEKHQLITELEIDGYVGDMLFDGNRAYVAQVAVQPDKSSGILVYDLQKMRQLAFHPIPQSPGQAPLSPASLALAGEGSLYINLFQFDEHSPCQQRGQLVRMDLASGQVTNLMTLDDVGPMVRTSGSDLLIGESCGARQGKLLRIAPERGEIVQSWELGPGISDIRPLAEDRFAISIFEDSAIAFFDARTWELQEKVRLPCVWPEQLAASQF
jgi:hypothetical protein